MRKEDAAYIAGFFDGEGNFSCDPELCGMKIMVGNTDEAIIRWIGATVGYGSIYDRKKQQQHWNQLYVWQVSNAHDCRAFLGEIRPYLRVKAKAADDILRMIASMQARVDRLDARNAVVRWIARRLTAEHARTDAQVAA
jgi:hypothetical protein